MASTSSSRLNNKRSFTGHHNLLPAVKPDIPLAYETRNPWAGARLVTAFGTFKVAGSPASMVAFTFGTGSVIWKIWPAVLFYTIFATVIVVLEEKAKLRDLAIPNVMLTVLGVVIGFVISYRAMSGYDRYWMGRSAWSDVIRNCRTMGRLVWYHVPPRLTPKTPEEVSKGQVERTTKELERVMSEKRMVLDMIEAFAVALKHHIRGETGIYYEDLYHLVRPLHDHEHTIEQNATASAIAQSTALAVPGALGSPIKARRIASNPGLPRAKPSPSLSPATTPTASSSASASSTATTKHFADPVIPPINAYGTFPKSHSHAHSLRRARSDASLMSISEASIRSDHQPLHPSQDPDRHQKFVQTMKKNNTVARDLIPFSGVWANVRVWVGSWFSSSSSSGSESSPSNGYTAIPSIDVDDNHHHASASDAEAWRDPYAINSSQRKWSSPVHPRFGKAKYQHHTHGHGEEWEEHGENLPLEILRCLSEWCSVLEDRNTVPGTSLGTLMGCIGAQEDSLVVLERILTTPLPFVYSVHIRHTVWIYLFFLPFQLIDQFMWYTIPGVTIAAFIYLGFLAAGEEIEQPFGYDNNDLDLDMFCQEIIHVDIASLKRSPCLNAYLPMVDQISASKGRIGRKGQRHALEHRRSMTLVEATQSLRAEEEAEE